jgi:hypothetical protein
MNILNQFLEFKKEFQETFKVRGYNTIQHYNYLREVYKKEKSQKLINMLDASGLVSQLNLIKK